MRISRRWLIGGGMPQPWLAEAISFIARVPHRSQEALPLDPQVSFAAAERTLALFPSIHRSPPSRDALAAAIVSVTAMSHGP